MSALEIYQANRKPVGGQLAVTQTPDAWQRMLEATKKEVREIRGLEARVKWGMAREEKKKKEGLKKEAQLVDMEWEHKDRQEMRELVEEKSKEQKLVELVESKDYQQFKRVTKLQQKEAEHKRIEEEYKKDTENAAWERQMAQALNEGGKVELQDHFEKYAHLKELKTQEKVRETQIVNEERQLKQAIEMDYRQRELLKEKEALLQSLDFTRTCSASRVRYDGTTNRPEQSSFYRSKSSSRLL